MKLLILLSVLTFSTQSYSYGVVIPSFESIIRAIFDLDCEDAKEILAEKPSDEELAEQEERLQMDPELEIANDMLEDKLNACDE